MFFYCNFLSVNSALLYLHLYETLPESNTEHLRLIMADIGLKGVGDILF